jgi:hypothetical protein
MEGYTVADGVAWASSHDADLCGYFYEIQYNKGGGRVVGDIYFFKKLYIGKP